MRSPPINRTAERWRMVFIDKKHLQGEASRGASKLQVRQPGFFASVNSLQIADFISKQP
jgi:hypothetical protein